MVNTNSEKHTFFQRIVVSVDGSESSNRAVEKAVYLSKNTHIPLSAVYVIDMNIYSKTLTSDQFSEQLKSVLTNEGESVLKKTQNLASEHDISVETKLLDGDPGEKIIEITDENDLIILGSKGKNAVDRIFIGSVSEYVLHHADSAVMIVR